MYRNSFRLLHSANVRVSFLTRNSLSSSIRWSTSAAQLDDDNNVESFRKLHSVILKGLKRDEECTPLLSFDDAPFPAPVTEALKRQGFTAPTPIQAQSWPLALAGRDMISVARTGSGKTCAFLLPAFEKIYKNPPQRRVPGRPRKLPTALVLAPTRELTQQIETEALKFSGVAGISVAALFGGASKGPQLRTLSRGVDLIVATPGRCNDLIEMGALDLSLVNYLVLDEADRMLDMGFEPQIRTIIDTCSESRQNLFFTATWPKGVQHLAAEYLNNPVTVNIGEQDSLNANSAITQHIHMIKPFEKPYKMEELLAGMCPKNEEGKVDPAQVPKTLVFMKRKADCDDLAYDLRDLGYPVGTLHGDKEQNARTAIMDRFRKSQIKVLVATDVAARGLDVKDIEVVINYDLPPGKSSGIEDYVHRIGRTARGSRTGIAHSFFTPEDIHCARDLVGVLERAGQVVPPELRALIPPTPVRRQNQYSRHRTEGGGGRYGNYGRGRQNGGRDNFDPISSGGGSRRRGESKLRPRSDNMNFDYNRGNVRGTRNFDDRRNGF
mmetsp:Transcript_16840/g.25322  ORF Transcript_16840/g.25322 Transcript_16840/m.25322 type:complete len:552 (+) Transcript_16840:58-1713(+)